MPNIAHVEDMERKGVFLILKDVNLHRLKMHLPINVRIANLSLEIYL